jgi:hypothetical protein
VVLVALVGGQGALDDSADANVTIELEPDTGVDATRQQIVNTATGAWQATQVAESSGSDDEATVEFSLPPANLDGLIGELRRTEGAESVEVNVDLEEDQVNAVPVETEDGSLEAPEPVTLAVAINGSSARGPWITIIGAALVALLALGAIALVQRRFGDRDFDDQSSGYH